MSSKESENKKRNKDNQNLWERTSLLEWIVAGIGLVIVAFSIGYVGFYALTQEETPPDLSIYESTVKKLPEGFLVEFTVENKGGMTASNVVIEGKLKQGEEEIEKKTTTMDYVASGSVHQGGLFFTKNPDDYELEVKAVGYEKP